MAPAQVDRSLVVKDYLALVLEADERRAQSRGERGGLLGLARCVGGRERPAEQTVQVEGLFMRKDHPLAVLKQRAGEEWLSGPGALPLQGSRPWYGSEHRSIGSGQGVALV